jgi:hypothetical protein
VKNIHHYNAVDVDKVMILSKVFVLMHIHCFVIITISSSSLLLIENLALSILMGLPVKSLQKILVLRWWDSTDSAMLTALDSSN